MVGSGVKQVNMKCLLERMETKDIFYKQEDFWENTELKMASSSESDERREGAATAMRQK